jgi:hypothetical protein
MWADRGLSPALAPSVHGVPASCTPRARPSPGMLAAVLVIVAPGPASLRPRYRRSCAFVP